jgi:hypothetical protein
MNYLKLKEMSFVTLCFIFNPLLTLPLVFFGIYNKRNYAFLLLIIFLGLLGFLWPPSGDLYRIQNDFEVLKTYRISEVFSFNIDFLYTYLMFFLGKTSLDFAYLRFLISIISYSLFFYVARDIITQNQNLSSNRYLSFAAFLIIFLSLGFGGIITGVRFTFAFSIFIYGYYRLFYQGKKNGIAFLILSVTTHFSFLLLFVVLIINKIVKKYLNFSFFMFCAVLALIFSTNLVENIVDLLPVDESTKIYLKNYTTGHFALEEFQQKSMKFRISRLLGYIIIYPALVYIIFSRKRIYQYSVFIILFIFLLLQWNMNSSFSRYSYIAVSIFIIGFLSSFELRNKYIITILFFTCLITYTASIYTVKRELFLGNQYKLVLYPAPLIILNTYDQNWIQRNIGANGSIISEEE